MPAPKKPEATPKPAEPPVEKPFDQEWADMSKADGDAAATATPPGDNISNTPNEPEQEPAAAPAKPATPPAEEDPLASLSAEELRARLITAQENNKHISARASENARKLNEFVKQAAAAATPVPPAPAPTTTTAPSAQQITQAMQTPEGWKQLQADYPTIAGGIEQFITANLQHMRTEFNQEVDKKVQARVSPLLARAEQEDALRAQSFFEQQVDALKKAHPDFGEIKDTTEFKEWIDAQPPMVQAGIKSQHATDAITVLNLYKAQTQSDTAIELSQRRQERLRQAASVPGVSGRAATPSRQPIPDEFGAAWEAMARQSANQK